MNDMVKIVLVILAVLAICLGFFSSGADSTYATKSPQFSVSVLEAAQRKTLITQLRPAKQTFKVAGITGRIQEVWFEKSWGYVHTGMMNHLRNIHPTEPLPGKHFIITYEWGNGAQPLPPGWRLTTREYGPGSTQGRGVRGSYLRDGQPHILPKKLYVIRYLTSDTGFGQIVDSIALH